MFQITSGTEIVHSPLMALQDRIAITPILERELNRQGSLTFSVAPTHPMYDDLSPRLSYVSVADDNSEIWRGRVISTERGFNGVRKVYCEGELSYFNDTRWLPYLYKGTRKGLFALIVNYHNQNVDAARQFALDSAGTTIDDTNQIRICTSEAKTSWEMLQDYILDYGYLVTYKDGNNVKIKCISRSDMTDVSDQTIEYGKNLLSLIDGENASNVITRLIPYGGLLEEGQPGYIDGEPTSAGSWNGNRLTIETATGQNGSRYIEDSTAVALWGVIVGTATFDDITVNGTTAADVTSAANRLLSAARGELNRRIGKTISIDVTAIDLSMVTPAYDPIEIGQNVWVISEKRDIKVRLMCKKLVLYLTQPDKNVFSLGAGFKTLTDLSGSTIDND